MTAGEIISAFRQAAEPVAQRRILAELNNTSVERIDEILRAAGAAPEELTEKPREKLKRRGDSGIDEGQAWALYEKKMNDGEIARAMGIKIGRIQTWRKRMGLPSNDGRGRKSSDQKEREQKRLEALCEQQAQALREMTVERAQLRQRARELEYENAALADRLREASAHTELLEDLRYLAGFLRKLLANEKGLPSGTQQSGSGGKPTSSGESELSPKG